jgi:hypothetical protein
MALRQTLSGVETVVNLALRHRWTREARNGHRRPSYRHSRQAQGRSSAVQQHAEILGGPADGEVCDASDEPITKQQLVMEGIASTLSDRPKERNQFWDAERRALTS